MTPGEKEVSSPVSAEHQNPSCGCVAELCFSSGFINFLTSCPNIPSLAGLHELFPAPFSQILNVFFRFLHFFLLHSSSPVVVFSVALQHACRAGGSGKTLGLESPGPTACQGQDLTSRRRRWLEATNISAT